jgi:hypothetical protein
MYKSVFINVSSSSVYFVLFRKELHIGTTRRDLLKKVNTELKKRKINTEFTYCTINLQLVEYSEKMHNVIIMTQYTFNHVGLDEKLFDNKKMQTSTSNCIIVPTVISYGKRLINTIFLMFPHSSFGEQWSCLNQLNIIEKDITDIEFVIDDKRNILKVFNYAYEDILTWILCVRSNANIADDPLRLVIKILLESYERNVRFSYKNYYAPKLIPDRIGEVFAKKWKQFIN